MDTLEALMKEYVPAKAAATAIGGSPRTLARYENLPDGLPSVMIAGRKYYRVEAIREFIERRERKPNPSRRRVA